MINIVLFLVVMVAHASVHLDRFALEGGLLHESGWTTRLLFATSIVILIYLCLAHSLKACHETHKDLRHRLNVALAWLLCAALVIIDIAWLSQAYPNLHPARAIGGILLVLLLLFVSPFCDRISITKDIPDSHWLYAISMLLSTFVLFLSNPIGLYVSSSEFVGGVYKVAITLGVFFVIAVSSLAALYLLMDSAARKVLTLIFVFLAVIVVAYSAMGVKDAGIMSQFLLPFPKGLMRTSREILVEVIILFLVLSVTSYATIKYRQNMTYVIGAMLVTTICVTAADIHRANGDEVVASKELPVDHVDIVSFSRDRNILIIMLDGFPGGYLQRIMEEVPEVLREYEGFTWFPNTVSTSADTLGAIATLAGGPKYAPLEINRRNYESVGRAINESYQVYIDAFVPNDYQVTYVNPVFAGGCNRLSRKIHCTDTFPYGIYYHNQEEPDVPILQGDAHVPLILAMVSMLKASPFLLKSWVYDDGSYRGANSTVLSHAAANSVKVKEWGFLRVLARESRADSRSNTFKFIQLSIPHTPTALNTNCKMQPQEATVFTEAVCALKELGALLSWMKRTGIYGATKIVVVSDHGWYVDNPMFPSSFEKTHPKLDGWLSLPGIVHPLLLTKDFEARGDFHRSDTFLSNSDVPSMVCSAVEACKDVGPDPTKIDNLERTLTFTRIRYPAEEVQAKKFDMLAIFEVRNSIFDPQNWTKVN
jgi:hypothetical protein